MSNSYYSVRLTETNNNNKNNNLDTYGSIMKQNKKKTAKKKKTTTTTNNPDICVQVQFSFKDTIHTNNVQQEKEKNKTFTYLFFIIKYPILFCVEWSVFGLYIFQDHYSQFFSALFPLPDPWIFYLLIYYHQIILYPIYNLLTLMV